MIRVRLPQRVVALLLILGLAACGGGGAHTAVPSVPNPSTSIAPQGTGKLALSITVPAANKTAQSKNRKAQFVSPATKSVAVKVAGVTTNIDLASGATGCAADMTKPSTSEIGVGSEPRGMTIGPNNNVYFVEDNGEGVGKIAGGVYSDVYTGNLQNSLIVGPDGYFWIANVFSSSIGHLKADWSSYDQFYGMPADQLTFAIASDKSVWYPTFTGSPNNALYQVDSSGNYLGSISVASAVDDVTAGPDGTLWAIEDDGTNSTVLHLTSTAGTWSVTGQFPVPHEPSKLHFSPSGVLWLVSPDGHVQTMTATGAVSPVTTLAGGVALQMSFAPDGALWLPEDVPNLIARITPAGTVTTYPIPTPSSDSWAGVAAPDGSFYFTERAAAKVGRIAFPIACSTVATVPAGSATVTITAYDATGGAGGSGKALSTESVPVNVPQNSTTTLNFVLNGIVNDVTIAADTSFNPGCNTSGSYPLHVTATDPSGNIIVGPGGYADQNGNALTFTLTTSDTSGHSTVANGVITAPAATPAPTLNWTGGTLNNQTITGTVSGGAITGSIFPAVLPGACT